jgi:hypothetical protein
MSNEVDDTLRKAGGYNKRGEDEMGSGGEFGGFDYYCVSGCDSVKNSAYEENDWRVPEISC